MTGPRAIKVTPDPATSETLPSWAYTDPQIFEREKQEIFYRSWHYAGSVSDLKSPGDYVTADVIDQSLIVLRGDDGMLRGFHNVCRHRGHQLLAGHGRVTGITCPYHAWSYRLDGELRSARGAEKSGALDTSQLALKPVRVEVFASKFVFVNLDLSAVPLSELAGELINELSNDIPEFVQMERVDRPASTEGRVGIGNVIVRANWKVVVDNCLECYHCLPIHPAFSKLLDMSTFRTRAHDHWASLKGTLARPDAVTPSGGNVSYRFWWLWPNTYFEMSPGGALGFTVGSTVPIDVIHSGQGRSDRYGVPGATPFEPRGYGDLNLVPEDRAAMESVQRGLASNGYECGRFNYDPLHGATSEEAVHRFHQLVVDALRLGSATE